MRSSLLYESCVRSHQGNVRSHNEDAVLCKPEAGLWVVADGMGGHEAGEVASQMIVTDLQALPDRAYISDFVDDVEDAIVQVNKKLRAHSIERLNGQTLGSTMACLIIRGSLGVVLWVGDSRLYRLHGGALEQLTKDHSEVQLQLDRGLITQEQADNSTMKNMLSRAIGAFDEVEVEVNAFTINRGDVFLLCSDGLYNELSAEELRSLLKGGNLSKVSDTLLAACLSKAAKDNVSFIVIKATA